MLRPFVAVALVAAFGGGPVITPEGLQRAKSSEELASIMKGGITGHVKISIFLSGILSNEVIHLESPDITIPVREVVGTILVERDSRFLEPELKPVVHEVRIICSFRDPNGELFRYSITKFTDSQFKYMEAILKSDFAKAQQPRT